MRSRPAKVDAMLAAFFGGKGETDPALRRAVAARAGAASTGPGAQQDVPDVVRPLLDKVANHAYKVVDDDIAELRAAGYSEDAIFELVLASALGAGLARLDAGLGLLGRPEGG